MISRNLFFSLQQEDFKRRLWSLALSLLAFFLLGPVLLALVLEGFSGDLNNPDTRNYILDTMSSGYEVHFILTIMGALVCAFSGFFYLHSKKKIDFYHSMPVKREKFFAVQYVDGVLIYLLPYIFNLLLSYVILFARNYMGTDFLIESLKALGINLLYFLVIYSVTIIAVMLTGNGIVSILGTGVFLGFGPLVMLVRNLYYSSFFETFVSNNSSYEKAFLFLSPIGMYIKNALKIRNGEFEGLGSSVLLTSVVIVLLTAFALFLYKNRPSETAGKAMTFELAKYIIKFMMLVPVTLGGGLIFMQASNNNSDGWLIFGLILVFIIFGAIIEIIYQFDLRKAFANKNGLAAAGGAIILIVCIFRFDLFHFDTYVPDKDKVASMSILIPGLDSDKSYTQINENGLAYDYYGTFEYQQKYMKIKDFDTVYEIAKLGVLGIDKEITSESYTAKIAYQLKNGKTVTRNYQYVEDKDYSLLSKVYETDEFKTGNYPIYQWKSDNITGVSITTPLEFKNLTLSKEDRLNLLDLYKKEFTALSIEDIKTNKPIATLTFELTEERGFEYYLFSNFTETLKFLEQHGFQASNQMKAEQVKKITVYDRSWHQDSDMASYAKETQYNDDEVGKVYEGKSEIQSIFNKVYPNNYINDYRALLNPVYDLEVNLVIGLDEYGNESYINGYFLKDNIPDFIIKDMNYKPESGK